MRTHKSIMDEVLTIHNHELSLYGYIGIALILVFLVIETLIVFERVYLNIRYSNDEYYEDEE